MVVDSSIKLEALDDKHAEPLLQLVNNNRDHLRAWLTWVDNMTTVDNFSNYIITSKKRELAGTELSFVIIYKGNVAGRIGVYNVDQYNKTGSIGYWLGKEYEGHGIMTKACKALINYCYGYINLNRIEIRCGSQNNKSQMIPERLQFTKEGTLRQAEFVNNQFIDLYLYSMIKQEWKD